MPERATVVKAQGCRAATMRNMRFTSPLRGGLLGGIDQSVIPAKRSLREQGARRAGTHFNNVHISE
ncbi:hypothetical protein GCM10008941_21910 [Rhizomicrobium palustre]